MLLRYTRVSTADQTLALQEDALHSAGFEKVFRDVISGAATARPGHSFCRNGSFSKARITV